MGIDDNLIKSFLILRRWLGFPPTIDNFNHDDSLPSKWLKDQTIDLPKDRKYLHCLMKLHKKLHSRLLKLDEMEAVPEENQIQNLTIMGDPNWFCLFKTDFSDKQNPQGNLRVKMRIEDIASLSMDKSDPKRVNIITSIEEEQVKISLIMENSKKAVECHEYLQYNIKQCSTRTCERIEAFLQSHLMKES